MNSPQTELFDKGATLFALDLAKTRIRRDSEAVIVEGQLDAISAHQAGFDNVVASMGTALTERQYWILNDLKIEKAVVTFDGDAPGRASAEKRGRELAAVVQRATRVDRAGRGTVAGRRSTNVYVAVLPEGTDPDELARRDPQLLHGTIAGAEPVLAFVIEQIRKRSDLVSPDGRRRFLAETLPVLVDEPDQLTRELYVGTLARLTGISEESLREQLAARPRGAGGAEGARPPAPTGQAAPVQPQRGEWDQVAERYLMAQLARFPEEAARLDLDPMELVEPDHRAVLELLRAGERPGPRFPAHLAAVVAALGASAPPPADEGDVARAISMAVMRVREENLRRRMGEVKAALLRGSGDVGQLMDELTTLGDDLARLMRTRERDTVREAPENEDE
jgi:DNA primase